MFRRVFAFIFICMTTLGACAGAYADAASLPDAIADGIVCAAVCEPVSGEVVFQKNADEKRDFAGLSRLPMLLCVCEAIDAGAFSCDTDVRISESAAAEKGPTAFVEAGESIGVESLLKAAVMILAGDAIHSLGEACFGTYEGAREAADARMGELGIAPGGDAAAYSANEMILLGKALIKSPTFLKFASIYMDEISHENGTRTELVNQNRLIKSAAGCIGLATGSSASAGYCGLFAVKRQDATFLCVIAGSANSKERFGKAQGMLDWAFSTYKAHSFAKAGDVIVKNAPVQCGKAPYVNLVAASDVTKLSATNEAYEKCESLPESLTAPLYASVPVGFVEYKNSAGDVVARVEVFPQTDVDASGFADRVLLIMKRWVVG